MLSDFEIIEKLRQGGRERQAAWEYMFKEWRSAIHYKVVTNGGTTEEVVHALGNICKSWEKRVISKDFSLETASLKHYLSTSVYYNWLRINQKQQISTEDISKVDIPIPMDEPLNDEDIRGQIRKVLSQTIGEKCQKVLCWHSAGYSMVEIGEMLEMRMESAKNLKFKCLKKLNDYFKENPNQLDVLKKMVYE